MSRARRPLIAGNWKMNHGGATACFLAAEIAKEVSSVPEVDVVVAPPYTAIAAVAAELDGTRVGVAGQNMNEHTQGAFTGEVSGPMLIEAGATWVLLGHSERRSLYCESDENIAAKVRAALQTRIAPIVCIGESLEQRTAGKTLEVNLRQLSMVLALLASEPGFCAIAYEPLWAIGTGHNATPEQAEEVHAAIRARLAEQSPELAAMTRILYGGSVKADNAAALLSCPNIDGALVGGASLEVSSFLPIVNAAARIARAAT